MWQRLLHYGRNFYVASGLGLLGWVLFFDANDLVSQTRHWLKVRELENERAYYEQKIDEVKAQRKEILGNDRRLEKFAREKYLMKKSTETVYVIVDETNEPIEK
ncbi:septum formation initiator family protein [Nibrella saemangeumensis]|uniref:Septum formation initiator family protein n=1 Tax=Nibrella saemangeumensis TaxID=1084526 RepID=A0ABP8NPJ2_9BACT